MQNRMRRLAALLLGSLGLLGAAATPQAPQAPPQDAGAQWDKVFSSKDAHWKSDANAFLAWTIERIDREKLLPSKRALDLAMGDGRNALLLAEKGFTVTGIDVSEVALEKAHLLEGRELRASRQKQSQGRRPDPLDHPYFL